MRYIDVQPQTTDKKAIQTNGLYPLARSDISKAFPAPEETPKGKIICSEKISAGLYLAYTGGDWWLAADALLIEVGLSFAAGRLALGIHKDRYILYPKRKMAVPVFELSLTIPESNQYISSSRNLYNHLRLYYYGLCCRL